MTFLMLLILSTQLATTRNEEEEREKVSSPTATKTMINSFQNTIIYIL
jgi:hypothetical protein